jgi:hypothetical protein
MHRISCGLRPGFPRRPVLQKWNRIVDKVDKNVGFAAKNAIKSRKNGG